MNLFKKDRYEYICNNYPGYTVVIALNYSICKAEMNFQVTVYTIYLINFKDPRYKLKDDFLSELSKRHNFYHDRLNVCQWEKKI